MKRMLAIFAAAALLITLAACDFDDLFPKTPTEPGAASTTVLSGTDPAGAPASETPSGGKPTEVHAEVDGDLQYVLSPDGASYTVAGNLPITAETLTIPSEFRGKPVLSIGKMAFAQCKNLKSVAIGNGIEIIGDVAFGFCPSLTSVTLPDSVKSIGASCFYNCTALTSADLGEGLEILGNTAFAGCGALQTVSVPSTIRNVGYSVFQGCDALEMTSYGNGLYLGNESNPYALFYSVTSTDITELIFAEGTRIIGAAPIEAAFGSTPESLSGVCLCKNLTSVTIPEGVVSIGYTAFIGCENLSEVLLPNSIREIAGNAFTNCNALKYNEYGNFNYLGSKDNPYLFLCDVATKEAVAGKIHASTVILSESAVTDMSEMPSVTVDPGNKYFVSDENALFDIGKTTLYRYFGKNASYTIPESVTKACSGAFMGNMLLAEVTLPSAITEISNMMFQNCPALKTVNMQGEITQIGIYAFSNCTSLTSFSMPDSVTIVGAYAFYSCTSLASVVVSKNLTFLGSDSFRSTALKSFTVPDGITSMTCDSFNSCSKLETVHIGKALATNSNDAFPLIGRSALTSITVDAENPNIKSLDGNVVSKDGTVYLCYAAGKTDETYTIPVGITTIDRESFLFCKIKHLIIPEGVTAIGNSAFQQTANLKTVDIPHSMKSIGMQAFDFCIALREIRYAGTMAEWNAISLGNSWVNHTTEKTVSVICTDGTIPVEVQYQYSK